MNYQFYTCLLYGVFMNKFFCMCLLVAALSVTTIFAYSGGSGTIGDPYQISDTTDLRDLMTTSGDWASHFILTQDLDASGMGAANPIGNFTTKFTGSFDGQNHTISNLAIAQTGSDFCGLFGYTLNAKLSNVGIINCNMSGKSSVGALCGHFQGDTVSNCYASGIISATEQAAGGLVGETVGGVVMDSYSQCNVTAAQNYAGGFIGWNRGEITRCYATGTVNIDGSNGGPGSTAGGFVGANGSWFDLNPGTITFCYATGNATAVENFAGGFVGTNNNGSTITDCNASGNALAMGRAGGFAGANRQATDGTGRSLIQRCFSTGNGTTTTGSYAGGFIGWNLDSSDIHECYSSGNGISGHNAAGGFCGGNLQNGTITDCYARGNASATDDWAGGFCGWSGTEGVIGPAEFTNCFSTGVPSVGASGVRVGGFVGEAESTSLFSCCFWDSTSSGFGLGDGDSVMASGLYGEPTARMQQQSTFSNCGFNFTTFWKINGGYPGLQNDGLPKLTTTAVSSIDFYTAVSGGTITDEGITSVTVRGVCWNLAGNPTISDSHTTDGAGLGAFVSNLTGLTNATLYHVRAYATNSQGTSYGNEITFTTIPTLPEWGLIALGALMAIIGAWFVMKKFA